MSDDELIRQARRWAAHYDGRAIEYGAVAAIRDPAMDLRDILDGLADRLEAIRNNPTTPGENQAKSGEIADKPILERIDSWTKTGEF